jgi:hypothetical protein
MSLETILVVNTASGCDTVVEQQITVTGPRWIVRIPPILTQSDLLMFM